MIDRAVVENLIAEAIVGTDCFLVDLKIGSANDINVEIDSDTDVSIQDCMKVSRGIEHNLDREETDFSLKVTSPGADQPLKVWRQYNRHVGRSLKIELNDDRVLHGKLLEVNDNGIRILTEARKEGKGKNKVKIAPEELNISKEDIKSTRVQLSFK